VLTATGRLSVRGGGATLIGGLPLGDEVSNIIAAAVQPQLDELDETTRWLVMSTSVFGRPFRLVEASRLVHLGLAVLRPAVKRAVASGILERQGPALTFSHDLVREAVYSLVGDTQRQRLHSTAAELVRAQERPLAEVAEHILHSGNDTADAVSILREAAAEISGAAPHAAAQFLMAALRRVPVDSPEWLRMFAQAGQVLISAGLLKEMRELFEIARARGVDPETEAAVLLGLAWGSKHEGDNAASVQFARRARSVVRASTAIQARAYAIEAHALAYLGDLVGAIRPADEADSLGRSANDQTALVTAATARSIVARRDGHFGEAVQHARSAVKIADRSGAEAIHRHPRVWLGRSLIGVDDLAGADVALSLALQEIERLGTVSSMPLWHFGEALRLEASGYLDDAMAVAEAGCDVAEQTGARQMGAPLRGLQAIIAVKCDALPLAHEYLRQQHAMLARPTVAPHIFISYSRADAGAYVRRLTYHLAAAGIPLWIDDDVNCGAPWERELGHQIDTCIAVVVVMTPHAAESPWVTNEIARARRKGKPILPLLLSGDVLFALEYVQYVDVTDESMPEPRFIDHLRWLLATG
jgi:tetratricopeptide (TPR) repeat protein